MNALASPEAPRQDPLGPCPLVVADIGGTNARFGWVDSPGHAPVHVQVIGTAAASGPGVAMAQYLGQLPPACRELAQRSGLRAAWALAAVVAGDEIALTNNGWRFSRSEEIHRHQLTDLRLYNDFEALAHALPHLGPSQLQACGGALPTLKGPLAVVGPGTGLGVAGLVPVGQGWHALSGEGGHMTLSAADDYESELLRLARRRWPHVSAERLLSGIGLPLLHECVCRAEGLPVHELRTEEILSSGLAGDPAARRTLEVFCAMLGSFAGNVALTLGAVGGVFIGGGLVPRLGDFFLASEFRARFERKGRFEGYLAAIGTAVVTDTMVALRGVSAAVAQHDRAGA